MVCSFHCLGRNVRGKPNSFIKTPESETQPWEWVLLSILHPKFLSQSLWSFTLSANIPLVKESHVVKSESRYLHPFRSGRALQRYIVKGMEKERVENWDHLSNLLTTHHNKSHGSQSTVYIPLVVWVMIFVFMLIIYICLFSCVE